MSKSNNNFLVKYSFTSGRNIDRGVLAKTIQRFRGGGGTLDCCLDRLNASNHLSKGRGIKLGHWRLGAKGALKVSLILVYFELIKSRWLHIIAQGTNVVKNMALELTSMLKYRVDPFHVFHLNP